MRCKTVTFKIYNLMFALLTLSVYNFYFWTEIFKTVSIGAFVLLQVIVLFLLLALQRLIFWRYSLKPLSILLVALNAIASYFIVTYHLVLNKTMLANIFDTNFFEATEWLGIAFWLYMFLFCFVPIGYICWVKIQFDPLKTQLLKIVRSLCIACVLLMWFLPYKTEVKIYLKEHFNLRYQFVPTSYISSLISLSKIYFTNVPFLDSTKGMAQKKYWNPDKKNLVVFVLGESARDASFSLSGYKRDTAEALRPYVKDMMVFHNTESCGVVTRVSVPCMFSPYTRDSYQEQAIPYTTNVLDILQRNQIDVLWLDNELGCNKVCRNIPTKFTCTTRDCSDMLLNESLRQNISSFDTDTVVVLHQRGSHGPRYDLRVPDEYKKWTPYCERSDFQNCPPDALMNAYDNTIHYTSFVLADMIQTLSKMTDEYNPILIYVSDHGESLGEQGVWGHGGDFKDAPDFQKQVPFFIWMPASSRKALGFDKSCLQKKTKTQQSHDVIFHSLLGLFGIRTDVYESKLDIFDGCHP